MCDCTECRNTRILFQLTEIIGDPKFMSDVTGCRKPQVSDCTSSTVFPMHTYCISSVLAGVLCLHYTFYQNFAMDLLLC